MTLKLQIKNNGEDPIEDGIRGKLSFPLPGIDAVYIQGILGNDLAVEICHKQGYAHGNLIKSSSSDAENSLAFTLNPEEDNQNFCRAVFFKLIDGQIFSPENIAKINDQCINELDKGHRTVQIECNKEIITGSSMAAQNLCGDGEFCPTYSGVIMSKVGFRPNFVTFFQIFVTLNFYSSKRVVLVTLELTAMVGGWWFSLQVSAL